MLAMVKKNLEYAEIMKGFHFVKDDNKAIL